MDALCARHTPPSSANKSSPSSATPAGGGAAGRGVGDAAGDSGGRAFPGEGGGSSGSGKDQRTGGERQVGERCSASASVRGYTGMTGVTLHGVVSPESANKRSGRSPEGAPPDGTPPPPVEREGRGGGGAPSEGRRPKSSPPPPGGASDASEAGPPNHHDAGERAAGGRLPGGPAHLSPKVSKAHRRLYHSTLGLRVIKKKRRVSDSNLFDFKYGFVLS